MAFSEKLFRLRREKGLSQENLADLLNVSRQSVSKWESGSAMPEIEKLVSLAEIFCVSIDSLLRDTEPSAPAGGGLGMNEASSTVEKELAEIKHYIKRQGAYEYISKTRIFGMPLLYVKFSRFNHGAPGVAKGFIAVGDIALGFISIGGIAAGVFSLGGLSLGLLLALGGLSLGCVAIGGVCLGVLASGGVAIGTYALGGAAIASKLAAGGAAVGHVAVGGAVKGEYTLLSDESTRAEIIQFIRQHVPNLPDLFVRLISLFGHAK